MGGGTGAVMLGDGCRAGTEQGFSGGGASVAGGLSHSGTDVGCESTLWSIGVVRSQLNFAWFSHEANQRKEPQRRTARHLTTVQLQLLADTSLLPSDVCITRSSRWQFSAPSGLGISL